MEVKAKFRIVVLGIGGVGGYFGGKLAAHFAASEDVEIIFIARGENEKAIKNNGLRIITADGQETAKPAFVTNEASESGEVDLFLICTKAYDLEESIRKYRVCFGAKTAILPLLNGVDNAEKIQKILPQAEVWNGCAFIVSRLDSPGVIKVNSDIKLLQFGSLAGTKEKLQLTENLFKEAGINAELSGDIEKTIWEKFIFISSLATLTSYLDTNIGGVNSSPENRKLLAELVAEVTQLAVAKKINVAENIAEITLHKIAGAPPESTSSMHSDFLKKGKTELESLTGYIVAQAKALNIKTPFYERLYGELVQRKRFS